MKQSKSPSPSPTQSSSAWETKCPFDFVIAYEDTATRNRVYHLYDHLAQQLFGEIDFRGTWYKFDFLANQTVRAQAAQEASQAHMIVLSLRHGDSLPGHVLDWIDAWTARRGSQKSALVTLVAGDGPELSAACPIQHFLQKTANLVGMDFFAHNFDFPAPRKDRESAEDAMARSRIIPAERMGFNSAAPFTSHWGINE